MCNHPGGGKKLEVLGVGVAEQHHHAVLAFVVVPLASWQRDVAVSVPDPVALNNFGGRLEADFRSFDRANGCVAYRTTDHLDLEIVKAELGQVAVTVLEVAIGAVDATRGERPKVTSIRRAIENFVASGDINIQGAISRRGEDIILPIFAASRGPVIDLRIERVVIIGVHVECLADLALIAHAADGEGLLLGIRQGGQQQRR